MGFYPQTELHQLLQATSSPGCQTATSAFSGGWTCRCSFAASAWSCQVGAIPFVCFKL